MSAATAMEATAATVGATAAMEPTTSATDATCAATEATCAAAESAAISEATASGKAATAGEAASAVEAASAIVPVEPRASADKEAAGEPTGTVVAVWSARVWVVSIVAIGAHRGRAIVARTDSNAEHNPLCMCGRRRNQANATYRQKSQNP